MSNANRPAPPDPAPPAGPAYGQTNMLMGIEYETAKRRKPQEPQVETTKAAKDTTSKTKPAAKKAPKLNKQPIKTNEVVPVGAVDMMPVDDGD